MNIDLASLKNVELFEHFIDQAQDTIPLKNQSYTLYEDLKIIIALKDPPQIQSKHFKELEEKSIIHRTFNSIKNRYVDYLSQLTENNFNEIASHLREQGLVGYLQFSNTSPKQFVRITTVDPKQMQSEKKKVEEQLDIEQKKVKTEPKKCNVDSTFPRNDFDKFTVEDLDQVLALLAESKNVPKAYLVERLHQLSGNLEDLDNLFNTNDDTYCFIEEEDQLLKDETSKTSPAIRLLIRKKGFNRVQRRLRYLGKQTD